MEDAGVAIHTAGSLSVISREALKLWMVIAAVIEKLIIPDR